MKIEACQNYQQYDAGAGGAGGAVAKPESPIITELRKSMKQQ